MSSYKEVRNSILRQSSSVRNSTTHKKQCRSIFKYLKSTLLSTRYVSHAQCIRIPDINTQLHFKKPHSQQEEKCFSIPLHSPLPWQSFSPHPLMSLRHHTDGIITRFSIDQVKSSIMSNTMHMNQCTWPRCRFRLLPLQWRVSRLLQ